MSGIASLSVHDFEVAVMSLQFPMQKLYVAVCHRCQELVAASAYLKSKAGQWPPWQIAMLETQSLDAFLAAAQTVPAGEVLAFGASASLLLVLSAKRLLGQADADLPALLLNSVGAGKVVQGAVCNVILAMRVVCTAAGRVQQHTQMLSPMQG